jgi:hypothetical protein
VLSAYEESQRRIRERNPDIGDELQQRGAAERAKQDLQRRGLGQRMQDGGPVAPDDLEYERQIDRGTMQSETENLNAETREITQQTRRRINPDDPYSPYRAGGLDESEKIRRATQRDPSEAFRHPTYEQLSADRDLRRGRTRMVPRDAYDEGGPVEPASMDGVQIAGQQLKPGDPDELKLWLLYIQRMRKQAKELEDIQLKAPDHWPKAARGGIVPGDYPMSDNIEDRRGEPPPEQGTGEDDRVEPTEQQKQRQLDDIEKARRDGTLKEYTTKDFERRRLPGPDEIQPRRAYARGGPVKKLGSKAKRALRVARVRRS